MTETGRPRAAGRPNATIQDVARAARVGRQTVSNVLNGSGRVGEAARARVLNAVTALGYQPHHGARSLRSRRTRQLAYVMPRGHLKPSNLIMTHFLQALAAESARRHYGVLIVVPDADPRDDIRRMIASRSVDAFVLSDLEPGDPRVEMLAEHGVPFACFGRTGPSLPQPWADIDNGAAQAAAVRYVLRRGFTRVAHPEPDQRGYPDHGNRQAGGRPGPAPGRRGTRSGPRRDRAVHAADRPEHLIRARAPQRRRRRKGSWGS